MAMGHKVPMSCSIKKGDLPWLCKRFPAMANRTCHGAYRLTMSILVKSRHIISYDGTPGKCWLYQRLPSICWWSTFIFSYGFSDEIPTFCVIFGIFPSAVPSPFPRSLEEAASSSSSAWEASCSASFQSSRAELAMARFLRALDWCYGAMSVVGGCGWYTYPSHSLSIYLSINLL